MQWLSCMLNERFDIFKDIFQSEFTTWSCFQALVKWTGRDRLEVSCLNN